TEGVLTQRGPTPAEQRNLEYGRKVARGLAQFDIGQTVVVADGACVAVEAMEGTDAAIRRALQLAGCKPLSVIKVAKPNQDMRFDVPVVGLPTIAVMQECGATALSLDAGKTLLFDRDEMLSEANRNGITIVGQPQSDPRAPASGQGGTPEE
ncbi:MAG: LpxI family protein, partial [Acidobacteria bacterium]|nr:LpxI family protein [Acidobacteriota bacterium]